MVGTIVPVEMQLRKHFDQFGNRSSRTSLQSILSDFASSKIMIANTPRPFYNDVGIRIMSVFDFYESKIRLHLEFCAMHWIKHGAGKTAPGKSSERVCNCNIAGGVMMFRKMRRFKQQLEESDALNVLKNGHRGILSLLGDEGYPYGVPVNYVVGDNGHIYIHCAGEGHKMDAAKNHDKVSFTMMEDQPLEVDDFALYVKSVIVFGRIRVVEDRDQVLKLVMDLARHIYPEHIGDYYKADLEKNAKQVQMLELVPEHITGKKVHER
jgi:nitroimidazol reductase NimA-like FMN-containing flavoprotein (pyridoxamine 5'-phosphate oxidase superfamily)